MNIIFLNYHANCYQAAGGIMEYDYKAHRKMEALNQRQPFGGFLQRPGVLVVHTLSMLVDCE